MQRTFFQYFQRWKMRAERTDTTSVMFHFVNFLQRMYSKYRQRITCIELDRAAGTFFRMSSRFPDGYLSHLLRSIVLLFYWALCIGCYRYKVPWVIDRTGRCKSNKRTKCLVLFAAFTILINFTSWSNVLYCGDGWVVVLLEVFLNW